MKMTEQTDSRCTRQQDSETWEGAQGGSKLDALHLCTKHVSKHDDSLGMNEAKPLELETALVIFRLKPYQKLFSLEL